MKKTAVKILSALLMLSMVFSTNVFAANDETTSAWDSFLGLFSTTATTDVGVEYRGHIENKGDFPLDGTWIQGPNELGTRGQFLRMEGFWIQLTNIPDDLNIKYNVHVQNEGWLFDEDDSTLWPENGEFCGTKAKMQRIEAVKIVLVDDEGNLSTDYDVLYQGHVQDRGDLPADGSWYENGEQLGTVASSLRLEALKVKIVQKEADLTEYNAAKAAVVQADYTTASWTTYAAVVAANVVDADNLQSEVDAATAAIIAAQANLVKVLKVESVSAINLKQISVTFNQAMKKTVAETLGNYAVTVTDNDAATTVASAILQSDNKTVILTLTGSYANQFTGKSLTITNMEATSGQTLASYIKTGLSYTDTVAPTVAGVATTGPRTIEVTFSEPVTVNASGLNAALTAGDFKLDNGSMAITGIAQSASRQVITLTAGADMIAGSHTLEYSSRTPATPIRDYAGLPLLKGTTAFTHALPSDALAATVTTALPDKITVTYNRAVKDVNLATVYANYTGVVGTPVAVDPINGYATVWNINFTTPLNGTVNLNIKNANTTNPIQDRYANKVADQVLTATVTADTTKPEVTTVTSTSSTVLKVDFSKDVNTSDVQNRYNYTILSASGTPLTTATSNGATDNQGKPAGTSSLVYTAANKQVVITLPQALSAGSYQVKIENIKDTVTYAPNTMVSTTKTFTVADTSDFVLQSAVLSDTNKITATFNKAVATSGDGSALLNANFKLDLPGTGSTFTDLPTNSTVTIGDQPSVVVITLGSIPSGFAAAQTHVYTTAKSSTGAALSLAAGSNHKVVTASAGTAVVAGDITNLKLLAHNQVSFEIKKPLSGINAAQISIADNVAAASATYVNQTLTDGVTYGALVTVTTADNALRTWVNDAAASAAVGNQAQTGRLAKATGANPAQQLVFGAGAFTNLYAVANAGFNVDTNTVKDLAAPAIVSYTTNDATNNGQIDQVTVVYSEGIKTGAINNAAYEVKDGSYVYGIANVTPVSPSAGLATSFTITLTERGVPDTGIKPAVKQLVAVNDNYDNQMVAQSTANIATIDGAKPVLISSALSNAITAGVMDINDTVGFTFSEPMNTANITTLVIGAANSGTVTSSSGTVFTFGTKAATDGVGTGTAAWTNSNQTATLTVTAVTTAGTTSIGGLVTPSVAGVTDTAGNALNLATTTTATGTW